MPKCRARPVTVAMVKVMRLDQRMVRTGDVAGTAGASERIGKKVGMVYDPPVSAMAPPITAASLVLLNCRPPGWHGGPYVSSCGSITRS
jgi:hypothetical protein